MKKIFLILILLFTFTVSAQESPSQWEVKSDHSLELNYNLLGRHTAQGAFYGAAGYGAGMWLSGNNTWWALAGSLISANIPLIFEKKFDEPEAVIGRNLGNLFINLAITLPIEKHRAKKLNYALPTPLQRRY